MLYQFHFTFNLQTQSHRNQTTTELTSLLPEYAQGTAAANKERRTDAMAVFIQNFNVLYLEGRGP